MGKGLTLKNSSSKAKPPEPKRPAEEAEEEEEEDEGPSLQSQFVAFIQHKHPEEPGTHITLTQIDFWLRQAKVIQVRSLTRTDTGICYFSFKKYKLTFEEFLEFLVLLANRKRLEVEDITRKLINCGPPSDEKVK